ncbi:MAG: hypothetical protein ACREU4_11785 [Burkholderiales bacterium]
MTTLDKGPGSARRRLRAVLHMTALVVLRHSRARRAFLCPVAAGKPKKPPLIAAIGKLGAPLSRPRDMDRRLKAVLRRGCRRGKRPESNHA